ncbi:hypothetical protein FOMPIDRAFT_1039285 [Fomitopsis schrenkii]|uniref:G domain-containing protein n=1 Tax=Fomitopsis schrenkii TaxID=2126942 RepID=S8EPG1_FOMSC|nr:hypothetical protein FOMPIDRAFT_1039285 [Fomitopsis schrenkii]
MAYNNQVVLVMGPSGTGKTRFVNLAADRDIFEEGSGLEATTTQAQSVVITVDGRNIEVIDTPGTDADDMDSGKAKASLLRTLQRRNIVGIVYMHDISQNRANGPVAESYKWLLKTCGDDAMRNVVIVTNMWQTLSGTSRAGYGEGRERELRLGDPCYKTAIDNGASLQRHDNTRESALAILRSVATKSSITLRCQMPASGDASSINSESTYVGTLPYGEKTPACPPQGRHSSGCFSLLRRHKPHGQSKRSSGEKDSHSGCCF